MASQITRARNASDTDANYREEQAEKAFILARNADVQESARSIQRNGNFVLGRPRERNADSIT